MIYTIVAKDKDDKVVAYFDFDCVRSFDLNMSANVSSTPVESAETITDNISYEPNTYSMKLLYLAMVYLMLLKRLSMMVKV